MTAKAYIYKEGCSDKEFIKSVVPLLIDPIKNIGSLKDLGSGSVGTFKSLAKKAHIIVKVS